MSQNQMILAHLERGETITPVEAYILYGSLALHSRIAELRGQGYRIDMNMQTNGIHRWGEYFMAVPCG